MRWAVTCPGTTTVTEYVIELKFEDSAMNTKWFLMALLCGVLVCAGELFADGDQEEDANGYFHASFGHLSSLDDYDVVVHFEETTLIDGLVVPKTVGHWRIICDQQKQLFFYAGLEKRVELPEALEGRLDKFEVAGTVLNIQSDTAHEYMLGQGFGTRKYKTFQNAFDDVSVPRFGYIGTGEFLLACLDPPSIRNRLTRAISAANQVSVRPTDENNGVVISAVFVDQGARETHQWHYRNDGLVPARYRILSKPRSFGRVIVDFDQKVDWEVMPSLGYVPVKVVSSKPVRLQMKTKDGARIFKQGERLLDVTFQWNEQGAPDTLRDFAKQSYTIEELESFVGIEAPNKTSP